MGTLTQILRQADTLKVTLSESGKKISELWVSRQRLEDLYTRLLLIDLEYALDKKVEQDLWNHAFKNQINLLQIQAKDKQNVKRGENQASLNLFLETASGFYLQLLQQICTSFKLDLPFRCRSASFGVMNEKCPLKRVISSPKKSSCLYICQHCLVHLGDIARYRQQVEQAQTYYRHAAQIVPQNGQPYNQLAILEAARGNKLSTVFYYIRSLAVRHPFPVAATNLEKFYIKLSRDIGDIPGKMSISEVINTFLQFTALVHLCSDLNKALSLRERLSSSLPSHITSQSFTTNVLLEMVAITVFSLSHAQKSFRDFDGEENRYSVEEKQAMELIQGFAMNLLDALLLATPKQEQKARDFFTLPPIKVLLDWLHLNPHVLRKSQLAESSLWFGLAKLLNSIQDPTSLENYDEIPLPEDCDLRCFQPLEHAYNAYSYSQVPAGGLPADVQIKLRCQRLMNHSKWLIQHLAGLNLLNCTTLKSGRLQFSTPIIQSSSTNFLVQGSEKRPGRQNVAIQAIIQKRRKPENSDMKNPIKQVQIEDDSKASSLTSSRNSSPKYLLGIPTSEPQFMKHGGKVSSNQRYPSPTPQQQSPSMSGSAKSLALSKGFPNTQVQSSHISSTHPNIEGKQVSFFQENIIHSPPSHGQLGPSNVSPGSVQLNPSGQPMPGYPQVDRSIMHPSRLPASQPGSVPDVQPMTFSPVAQHHVQAAILQSQRQQQPYPNMPVNQLLQMMKMAGQIPSVEHMGMDTALPGHGQQKHFPQAPRKETPQMLGKVEPPHVGSTRMANFPNVLETSGYTNSPMRPMMPYGHLSNQPQPSKESHQPAIAPRSYGGLSPQTIQPPPPALIDSRQSSAFQGHAEGTPKPDMSPDRRDIESGGEKGMPQPRTYSLFSSSPWEVPPLAGGDTGCPVSSTFSPASNRSSSDRDSNQPTPMSMFRGNTAPATKYGPRVLHPSSQYAPSNTQLLWSSSGPSPLERLLEQQKQQRQGDSQ